MTSVVIADTKANVYINVDITLEMGARVDGASWGGDTGTGSAKLPRAIERRGRARTAADMGVYACGERMASMSTFPEWKQMWLAMRSSATDHTY